MHIGARALTDALPGPWMAPPQPVHRLLSSFKDLGVTTGPFQKALHATASGGALHTFEGGAAEGEAGGVAAGLLVLIGSVKLKVGNKHTAEKIIKQIHMDFVWVIVLGVDTEVLAGNYLHRAQVK